TAMSGDSLLPYHTAQSSTRVGLFNTTTGKLQQQLRKGEYDISVESHHKAAGNKTIQKAAGPCSGGRRATRDDQKDKGHGSPGGSEQGTAHKGISPAPITNESRTSHKSGRSLSTA
ncbi:hypothetical protein EI555_006968, partial [Monodon monoceros]